MNSYEQIKEILKEHEFKRTKGGVYIHEGTGTIIKYPNGPNTNTFRIVNINEQVYLGTTPEELYNTLEPIRTIKENENKKIDLLFNILEDAVNFKKTKSKDPSPDEKMKASIFHKEKDGSEVLDEGKKKKLVRFDVTKELKAIARERVGQPKPKTVMTPKNLKAPKYKDKFED